MAEAEKVPPAIPADVIVQHVANPPPAVVPVVQPQPVEAAVEQIQNEVRQVFYRHLVFFSGLLRLVP